MLFTCQALTWCALAVGVLARDPYRLAGIVAGPGTIATGFVRVRDTEVDKGTQIPVSVVHGAHHGPTLLLIAGIHGSEYNPIVALQRLPSVLDPKHLSGTVVVVHIANPPAFFGRTIYTSPQDSKNLNRLFPGKSNGTVSDRIAHVLSEQFIARAHAVIDLHCGDANEDMLPWAGYYAGIGGHDLVSQSRALVEAFGVSPIVQFPFHPTSVSETIYTGPTALTLGIPSFDVEVGRLGQVEGDLVETIVDGLKNVMRYMGILPEQPLPIRTPWYVAKRDFYVSHYSGFFYNKVKAGDHVKEGQTIGHTTDVFGEPLQHVTATNPGIVLLVVARPATNANESVAVVAVRSDPGF
ncbi:Succinylglutamate desuccinylase [Plasmodiophora brassicae]|uniref:Succinylglutamate desuccinylase/Aspartoacylase catalytic domain-containing protein n=1 Tax=Plasmodiophora brassicae TaxID=37360 RepID=A0A0G4J7Z6_PLABS|nr:hypothetical protein PBRA_003176 [Plasmodiophora brassicae]SPQ95650.1 unnamed protein product [Plasmodiophora brassicae]